MTFNILFSLKWDGPVNIGMSVLVSRKFLSVQMWVLFAIQIKGEEVGEGKRRASETGWELNFPGEPPFLIALKSPFTTASLIKHASIVCSSSPRSHHPKGGHPVRIRTRVCEPHLMAYLTRVWGVRVHLQPKVAARKYHGRTTSSRRGDCASRALREGFLFHREPLPVRKGQVRVRKGRGHPSGQVPYG